MENYDNDTSIEILLVEDNPGDVGLTKEALKEGQIKNNLSVVEDGEEALRYLHKEGKYTRATRPDFIFLDLNLPKKNGQEVLREIKSDKDLKQIPVIVLTTSKAKEDIKKAYDNYANCYITKPDNLEQFANIARTIKDFWRTVVKLPPE